MHPFWRMPTRGGKLTILNCVLWAIFGIGLATDNPLLQLPAVVACWPLGMFLLGLPARLWYWSTEEALAACVLMGLNSLVWGYGVSWMIGTISQVVRMRRHRGRGFEVIVTEPGLWGQGNGDVP